MKILLTYICQLQYVIKNKMYLIDPVVFLKMFRALLLLRII